MVVIQATAKKYQKNQNTMSGLEFFNRNTTKGMCLRCIGRGYITQINGEKMLQPYSQRLSELFQGKIVRKNEYVRQLKLFLSRIKSCPLL